MELRIVLSKEVVDESEAQTLYDLVKTKLADQPDIQISGSTSQQIPQQ